MPPKSTSCSIGIDVGGTNTDAVILQEDQVLAWHKTPTTSDIQAGVELAIQEVIKKGDVHPGGIKSVKIGTTQFVNAVIEQDASKLDKVAVIRLCGPYSQGSPPFADFPVGLRNLMEGHCGYVDGGYQAVDGHCISKLKRAQLEEQAIRIKQKSITSVVVIGIYSPSNPAQENEAAEILSYILGPSYDVSCSHRIGRLGFLERENASILNASLRRFARHVIQGFELAVRRLGGCKLYITLNDGTLSKAKEASEHPVRCFKGGPTNSARGAAFLSQGQLRLDEKDDSEILVVDVGGTTTDICALLESGFPRQSAAFVKIAGVRTNFTIPDVHSIALGGGSVVRDKAGRTTVGPDSVGSRLEHEAIYFGGETLTTTDLVLPNGLTERIAPTIKTSGLQEIKRVIEEAIDMVKTKQGDATVVLVGGGSIIIDNTLAGVRRLLRPAHYEVANAVGAAIGKISGMVDIVAIPTSEKRIDEQLEEAKALAIKRCVVAGGSSETTEIVEIDVVPISYVTNGATRLMVRVVADLVDEGTASQEPMDQVEVSLDIDGVEKSMILSHPLNTASRKASTYDIVAHIDVESYRPNIKGDLWYLSEIDLQFLQDGAGILGVGSCGEPYPSYIACMQVLESGKGITIKRQNSIPDNSVVLIAGFMGSPTVYLERIPGEHEVINGINAVLSAAKLSTFDAIIPNEIGGLNAFEALLAASRLGKTTLDTDCVARAYPFIWQTVRCLNGVSVAPAAVADGQGETKVLPTQKDYHHAENVLREACTDLGSLSGVCVNPIYGTEARTLPKNSFSHAWTIGRSIALSRARKQDPVQNLVDEHNGVLLFSGKIISVTRNVSEGFTRGSVTLSSSSVESETHSSESLFVEFENENLCAILRRGKEEILLAICPDLITFLDRANGAPLGVSDYKYGLRVSVIALRAPPVWTTKEGLEMGGPKAFGLNMEYRPVSTGPYEPPKSVWAMFGERE
ncbi:hypothetical protein K469DRAFT_600897 [Zopfia rhizophila CBS 207.26]|uniref:DUF917-domain-containing protein n=1 Tax=Zopfia rhizophila CBS 207.26 TaxID=1314779 RepID=A0A6A6DF24_9PEZI|nr:hypothetical protein K469DRAFT_600897 [Zopfia rhizophila CBS 207.26]